MFIENHTFSPKGDGVHANTHETLVSSCEANKEARREEGF